MRSLVGFGLVSLMCASAFAHEAVDLRTLSMDCTAIGGEHQKPVQRFIFGPAEYSEDGQPKSAQVTSELFIHAAESPQQLAVYKRDAYIENGDLYLNISPRFSSVSFKLVITEKIKGKAGWAEQNDSYSREHWRAPRKKYVTLESCTVTGRTYVGDSFEYKIFNWDPL